MKIIAIFLAYLLSFLLVMAVLAGIDLAGNGIYELSSVYRDIKVALISTSVPAAIGVYRIYRKRGREEKH
jgi:predicted permease